MPLELTRNDEKLRELILLIAQESESDAPFGATKLNKLLFYIDFTAYVRFGRAATQQEYQRLRNGPAPKRLLPIIKFMQSQKDCAIAKRDYFGRKVNRTIALRSPNLADFTPEEVNLAHSTIKFFWGIDARGMSDRSHRFAGWGCAADRETIPYNVALIQRGKRNEAAESYAATLASKATEFLNRDREAS